MGTNFYARIIPKEEDKQKLKESIEVNDFDTIISMVAKMYASFNEYTREGGEIHLGKSSCGWKFLWNSNIYEYCDGYLDENKKFVPVTKYHKVYELTKKGITDFISREDIEIYDEYGVLQDKAEFLEYAFNKEGIDCKEYYNNPKYETSYYYHDTEETLKKFKALGFNPEYGDFYSDGLRFSTSVNFS